MSRTLIKSVVWRKLQVSLMVQQKWVTENKDKALMDRANRRVAHLVRFLEALNDLDDAPVICHNE